MSIDYVYIIILIILFLSASLHFINSAHVNYQKLDYKI